MTQSPAGRTPPFSLSFFSFFFDTGFFFLGGRFFWAYWYRKKLPTPKITKAPITTMRTMSPGLKPVLFSIPPCFHHKELRNENTDHLEHKMIHNPNKVTLIFNYITHTIDDYHNSYILSVRTIPFFRQPDRCMKVVTTHCMYPIQR
jgi:hypothetical protein